MRKENSLLITISILVAVLIGVGAYVYKSAKFERTPPKIYMVGPVYWNFKSPIRLVVTDDTGVKYCKVKVEEPTREMLIYEGSFDKAVKLLDLNLTYPKNGFVPTSDKAIIRIEARDGSYWNFFSGNKTIFESSVIADNKPPQVEVIANSFSIAKGGSALVVFEAKDENLDRVYVETTGGKIFNAQPFVKNGFYAALIAWDIKSDNFSAFAVATDKARNVTKAPIRILGKNIVYKDSKIELKDDFLDGKIAQLAADMPKFGSAPKIDRFIYVNSTMRKLNENLVRKITDRVGVNMVNSYFTEPFVPIARAAIVGTYGDHRNFFYQGAQVSEAYHMGIDFASTKEAPILAPNDGVVMFTGNNGIYGNLMIVYHDLGFFTIYGHCSSFVAKEGQRVSRGDIIANTGMTGLALGDHLHFGTIVQGVDVRPIEWLDKKWIDTNIIKVMNDAKKTLDSKQ